MKVKYSSLLDVGLKRKSNEDYLGCKVDEHRAFFIVADGMGGYERGDYASQQLVEMMLEWFTRSIHSFDHFAFFDALVGQIHEVNDSLLNYSKKQGIKLGTTVAGVMIFDNKVVVLNVGDSRVYRITDTVEQISIDHTWVSDQENKNLIEQEEAKHHKKRNVLTRTIGMVKEVYPYIKTYDDKATYLIVTDGGYNDIDERKLHDIFLSNDTQEEKLARLKESAYRLGARDNMAMILIELED